MTEQEYMYSDENLSKIQTSLGFLSDQLLKKGYTIIDFRNDCIAYLKELQYNNRIPKNINIEKEIYFEDNKEKRTVYVNFSDRLESFLTKDGELILDVLTDKTTFERD